MAKRSLVRALESNGNYTETENGALTHKSTLDDVLDFFYHAPAKRNDVAGVLELFRAALKQDVVTTMKALFYLRDCRGGQGERQLFRHLLHYISATSPKTFIKLIPLVPEYGRWDDLLNLHDISEVVVFIRAQLKSDMNSKTPSLLGKWMPSENTSSETTRAEAKRWMEALGLSPKHYRKMLTSLRTKLRIVEQQMSASEWDSINYSTVPSVAGLKYRKAFGRHDGERYGQYIEAAKRGEVKINASVLYPYQLMSKYINNAAEYSGDGEDATVEAMWKQLPDYGITDALVMCDVSGSMCGDGSGVRPIDVSVSLAIYCAEHMKGAFKNTFITFTDKPTFIRLKGDTLYENVISVFEAGVGYNTNIQAAYDMLLRTAKKNDIPDEEMPRRIVMISDMEFDAADNGRQTNFEAIGRKYRDAGYTMPQLVFWNVASRGKQTPVEYDERGVCLLSGKSPAAFKGLVTGEEVTPVDTMMEILNGERYAAVGELFE